MVKELTTEEFKKKIFDYTQLSEDNQEFKYTGNKPCIIDFYAEWCQPCKILTPILEELSEEYENIDIWKVNTENEMELSQIFGIKSIPTMLLIPTEGQPQMTSGALPKDAIIGAIDEVLLNKTDDETDDEIDKE